MNIKFALLMISLISCSTSCSNSSAPISISANEMGKRTLQSFLALRTGSGLWTCYGGHYSSASGFVHSFAAYSENMQFPVVIWAADRKRTGHEEFMQNSEEPCFEMPDHKPWSEALTRIARWAGPYNAREFPGFVEIAWANSDQEQSIRKAMGRSVPPILFRSLEAVDYLWMWHEVSGMDFKYDRTLIENAREWDRIRLTQVSDPEMPVGESLGRPFDLGFLQFEIRESLSVDDFMPKLAAHIGGLAEKTRGGWVIQKFERNEKGLELIEDCISRIKRDPYDDNEPAEILGRIGVPALPEILREFESTHIDQGIESQAERVRRGRVGWIDDRIEAPLIKALFWIKSPKRDEALLKALRRGSINDLAIAKALAFSDCKAAIPLIEQISSRQSRDPERQAEIISTLRALGETPQLTRQNLSISISDTARNAMDTPTGKQLIELITAVLEQCQEVRSGMQIQKVAITPFVVVQGEYAKQNYWAFEVPVLLSDRAVVRFSYICGPLCSGGFLGRIKRVNGNWIVTSWDRLWLS